MGKDYREEIKDEFFHVEVHRLGTVCDLWTRSGSENELIKTEFLNNLEKLENKFSRFLNTSETALFNTLKVGKWQIFSDEFIDLTEESLKWGGKTHGLFNPFLLPMLQKIGYTESWNTHAEKQIAYDYEIPDLGSIQDLLEINREERKIMKKQNLACDFGGIGKGYITDILKEKISELSDEFCINLGGDLTTDKNTDWEISILNEKDEEMGYVKLKNMSAATSSTQKRVFSGGSHIIDPIKGKSVDSKFKQVSVIAQSTVVADVCAKCILINPKFSIPEIIQAHAIDFKTGNLVQII